MSIRLVPLSGASLRALYAERADWATDQPELAGVVWPEADRRVLRYRVEALGQDPDAAPYLVHVALEDGRFVGRIGCHAAPDAAGVVEIGYAVVAAERGRGLGGVVVDSFLTWLASRGVSHVEASVGPGNVASLRLLRRRGFAETGERWDDEDGREIVLTRTLAAHPEATARAPGLRSSG